MSCGFNCHCPRLPTSPRSPGTEMLPARAGVKSGVNQPHPRASREPACFQHWESLAQGKRNLVAAHGGPGSASRPPREAAQHIPAISAEWSILREGIPALLTQTASLCSPGTDERLLSARHGVAVWPGGPPQRRGKVPCGNGVALPARDRRLPGTGQGGGCFPSMHVRSKRRKKEKETKPQSQSFKTAGGGGTPFPATQPVSRETLA